MIGSKMTRSAVVAAFGAVIAAMAGCGSASDSTESAAITNESVSMDGDRCGAGYLADFGVGFQSCGLTRFGSKPATCSAQSQLETQLAADGCRLCVGFDGVTRAPTRVDPIDPRSEYDWWCAVCPQSSAVVAALTNPTFTAFPVRVRAARACVGNDVLKPGMVGPLREYLVEWDPRCPAGGCATGGM